MARNLVFVLAVAVGCGGPTTDGVTPNAEPKAENPEPAEPTEIDVSEKLLTFDPATVKLESWKVLGLGLGSVTVKILDRNDGRCSFEFTHEIEMGYKQWKVSVPVDSGPVEVRPLPDGAEVSTSFDLETAEYLGAGGGPPEE